MLGDEKAVEALVYATNSTDIKTKVPTLFCPSLDSPWQHGWLTLTRL